MDSILPPELSRSLTAIGLITVSYCIIRPSISLLHNLRLFLFARLSPCCRVNLAKLGKWAVVTGASEGLGREFALQLARRYKLNVVLISRSLEKLNAVATRIESESKVHTKCLPIDFNSDDINIYDKIANELSSLDIGVLVNNVGVSTPYPSYFCGEFSNQELQKIIRVNCNAVTFMSRTVLPGMLAKRRGLVMNISSQLGTYPAPLMTVYGATKAYVDMFSRSLAADYRDKGVHIQSVLPGFVATSMTGMKQGLLALSCESVVKSTLATAGLTERTAGCLSYNVLWTSTLWTWPERLQSAIVRRMMNYMRQILLKSTNKEDSNISSEQNKRLL